MDLTVALPVYNEEAILDELHRRLEATLRTTGVSFEILFVDDGSTDGSAAELRRLAAAHDHVTVVALNRNWGHAAALKAAVDLAAGDRLVLMDADLQDEPELIPRLLEAATLQDAEIVYVVRTERGEARRMRGLFRIFHWAISRSSTYALPRDAGSFGLIGPRALADIRRLDERLRYFPGLRAFVGYRQVPLPAPRHARYDGHSRVGFGGLVQLAAQAFFSQSRIPALAFYWLSLVSLAVSVVLVGYAVTARVVGAAVVSWASIVTAISFFSSVIILGLALVFEYLARIYEEVRQRPVYLVDTVHHARAVGSADDRA